MVLVENPSPLQPRLVLVVSSQSAVLVNLSLKTYLQGDYSYLGGTADQVFSPAPVASGIATLRTGRALVRLMQELLIFQMINLVVSLLLLVRLPVRRTLILTMSLPSSTVLLMRTGVRSMEIQDLDSTSEFKVRQSVLRHLMMRLTDMTKMYSSVTMV